MYPVAGWSLEAWVVRGAALYEIALLRQKGLHGEQLIKAAAEIDRLEQMRQLALGESAAQRAAAAQCDLCDEYGWIVDEDGDESQCLHGNSEKFPSVGESAADPATAML